MSNDFHWLGYRGGMFSVSKVTPWVKAAAAMPEGMSLIPGTDGDDVLCSCCSYTRVFPFCRVGNHWSVQRKIAFECLCRDCSCRDLALAGKKSDARWVHFPLVANLYFLSGWTMFSLFVEFKKSAFV